jgi:hypothetical protein
MLVVAEFFLFLLWSWCGRDESRHRPFHLPAQLPTERSHQPQTFLSFGLCLLCRFLLLQHQ